MNIKTMMGMSSYFLSTLPEFTGFYKHNHNKQQKSLHPEGIGKKSRGKAQKSEGQNRCLFCSSLF